MSIVPPAPPTGDLVAVPATVDGGTPWLVSASVDEGAVVLDDVALTADAARSLGASLIALADGVARAPRRASGARRYRGRLLLSRAVHDAVVCGWRIATRDDERTDLVWCAGCGCAIELGAPAGDR